MFGHVYIECPGGSWSGLGLAGLSREVSTRLYSDAPSATHALRCGCVLVVGEAASPCCCRRRRTTATEPRCLYAAAVSAAGVSFCMIADSARSKARCARRGDTVSRPSTSSLVCHEAVGLLPPAQASLASRARPTLHATCKNAKNCPCAARLQELSLRAVISQLLVHNLGSITGVLPGLRSEALGGRLPASIPGAVCDLIIFFVMAQGSLQMTHLVIAFLPDKAEQSLLALDVSL